MLDAPLADWSNRCRREYLSPTLCSSNTSSIETLPRWYMDKMMVAYDAANCGLQMQDRLQWQWSWTCGHFMAFLCERVLILWSVSLSTGSFQWTMKWCWLRLFWGYWRLTVSCSFQITQSFRGSPSLLFCDLRRPKMPILNKQARYLDEGEEYWNILSLS